MGTYILGRSDVGHHELVDMLISMRLLMHKQDIIDSKHDGEQSIGGLPTSVARSIQLVELGLYLVLKARCAGW